MSIEHNFKPNVDGGNNEQPRQVTDEENPFGKVSGDLSIDVEHTPEHGARFGAQTKEPDFEQFRLPNTPEQDDAERKKTLRVRKIVASVMAGLGLAAGGAVTAVALSHGDKSPEQAPPAATGPAVPGPAASETAPATAETESNREAWMDAVYVVDGKEYHGYEALEQEYGLHAEKYAGLSDVERTKALDVDFMRGMNAFLHAFQGPEAKQLYANFAPAGSQYGGAGAALDVYGAKAFQEMYKLPDDFAKDQKEVALAEMYDSNRFPGYEGGYTMDSEPGFSSLWRYSNKIDESKLSASDAERWQQEKVDERYGMSKTFVEEKDPTTGKMRYVVSNILVTNRTNG